MFRLVGASDPCTLCPYAIEPSRPVLPTLSRWRVHFIRRLFERGESPDFRLRPDSELQSLHDQASASHSASELGKGFLTYQLIFWSGLSSVFPELEWRSQYSQYSIFSELEWRSQYSQFNVSRARMTFTIFSIFSIDIRGSGIIPIAVCSTQKV